MADTESEHHHYWPGEELISLIPQAVRFGYVFPVYTTQAVWDLSISWKQGKNTNVDKRIYELLDSTWKGMGKALSSEPGRVMFPFKHWYWERHRPQAKKQMKSTYAVRMFLDPENEEPWMLIFDPQADDMRVLDYGEPGEHREPGNRTGEAGDINGPALGTGVREEGQSSERSLEGGSDELERPPGGS